MKPIRFISLENLITLLSQRHDGNRREAAQELSRIKCKGYRNAAGYAPVKSMRGHIRHAVDTGAGSQLVGYNLDEIAKPLNLLLPTAAQTHVKSAWACI